MVNFRTLSFFSYKTEKQINNTEIKEDHVLLIIKNLKPNKAQGWNAFISMMQLCGKIIRKPSKYLFESSKHMDGKFFHSYGATMW